MSQEGSNHSSVSWAERVEQTRAWEADRREEWGDLDRRLRAMAKQRGALDAKEAELLRDAEELKLWRAFGYASLLEYMERAMGYSPHTAVERLRVARALVELPLIAEALENGEIKHSAVRELTRVASSDTTGAVADRASRSHVGERDGDGASRSHVGERGPIEHRDPTWASETASVDRDCTRGAQP